MLNRTRNIMFNSRTRNIMFNSRTRNIMFKRTKDILFKRNYINDFCYGAITGCLLIMSSHLVLSKKNE
jgi:hypothetical protein